MNYQDARWLLPIRPPTPQLPILILHQWGSLAFAQPMGSTGWLAERVWEIALRTDETEPSILASRPPETEEETAGPRLVGFTAVSQKLERQQVAQVAYYGARSAVVCLYLEPGLQLLGLSEDHDEPSLWLSGH